jgi:hypothetical protein
MNTWALPWQPRTTLNGVIIQDATIMKSSSFDSIVDKVVSSCIDVYHEEEGRILLRKLSTLI